MGKSFASARAGMLAGQTAGLSRLTKGVPRMLTHVATLKKYAGSDIPLGFLVVKGAWESAGVPTTVSGSGNDVGLFQIIIRPGETLAGYSYEQLKQAGPNTAIFTKRVRAWTKSLLSKHRGWFSGPDDQALWGVEWLFGAIGSHASTTSSRAPTRSTGSSSSRSSRPSGSRRAPRQLGSVAGATGGSRTRAS